VAWRLLDLGYVDPYRAQCFYEATALAVGKGIAPPTVILCLPISPYICIGVHQILENVVDVDYCKTRGYPIIRRSLGGGAVFLNSHQLFFQIIGPKDHPQVPPRVDDLFRYFLTAIVAAYRRLGIPAEYRPVNDIVVRGRKISGTGAGIWGNAVIVVGNFIMDFNFDEAARVLRVPDEKFRDKLVSSMREWITSIRRELGTIPPLEEIKQAAIEGFKTIGIELKSGEVTPEEERFFSEEVLPRHKSHEWLHAIASDHPALFHRVKVAHDVTVVEVRYKARKLIRVIAQLDGYQIRDIAIAGDFFAIPYTVVKRIESALIDKSLDDENAVRIAIQQAIQQSDATLVGATPEDIFNAVLQLRTAVS